MQDAPGVCSVTAVVLYLVVLAGMRPQDEGASHAMGQDRAAQAGKHRACFKALASVARSKVCDTKT